MVEIGLVILSNQLVKFLLRPICPDYYEELRLLLHYGGSRAGRSISRIQGVNGASLGDNSMHAYNCKWALQQPQSKVVKATQTPWRYRSESLLPESNLDQLRCWQRV